MKYFIFLFFFLCGCSSVLTRPQLDSSIEYQRDVVFSVRVWLPKHKAWSKEYWINGMGVMPEAEKYEIKVLPPGKADMITVTSCHREEKTANPKKNGWFEKGYTFQIDLVKGLESMRACPLDIGIYEKKAGRHAWGMMAIATGREKLSANTKCNGRVKQYGGVSVCQARAGLLQRYEFKVPVEPAYISGCEIKEPKDKMNWEFLMPKGACTVYFIDEKNPDIFHQANFFGYQTIPIRGVE